MERKITVFDVMCFVALAGLSIGSVSCLPVGKDAIISIRTQPRNMTVPELDLRVEVVYHDGRVKKYMSYLNYVPSADSNGTLQVEKPSMLYEYIGFLQCIPPPILSSSILAAPKNKTCLQNYDVQVRRGRSSYFWAAHNNEQSYTGLLRQCDRHQITVLMKSLPDKNWFMYNCIDEPTRTTHWFNFYVPCNLRLDPYTTFGSNPVKVARALPLNASVSAAISVPTAAIPVYTVDVRTADRIMILKPLVNFNVSSFVKMFPFHMMEIEYVVISVTFCSAGEKETLKTAMRYNNFVVQEEFLSNAIVFVKMPKATKSPKPRSAAVPGKAIGHHLSLLIGIVGIGMKLQMGLFLE